MKINSDLEMKICFAVDVIKKELIGTQIFVEDNFDLTLRESLKIEAYFKHINNYYGLLNEGIKIVYSLDTINGTLQLDIEETKKTKNG